MALSFYICAIEDQCSRGPRLMALLLRSRFLPSVTLEQGRREPNVGPGPAQM